MIGLFLFVLNVVIEAELIVTRDIGSVDTQSEIPVLDVSSHISDTSVGSRNHHVYLLDSPTHNAGQLLKDPSRVSILTPAEIVMIDPQLMLFYSDSLDDQSVLEEVRKRSINTVAIIMTSTSAIPQSLEYLFDFHLILDPSAFATDAYSWVVPSSGNCRLSVISNSIEVHCGASTITSPPKDRTVRFSFLGDWGAVGEGLAATSALVNKDVNDFIIFGGDNIYEAGIVSTTDPKLKEVYWDHFGNLTIPQYVILGNHDWFGNALSQLLFSQHSPKWTADYYYYSHRTVVKGTSVCTVFLETDDLNMAGQVAFLHASLQNCSQDDWIVVAGHHPVFSTGGHGDSRSLQNDLQPIFDLYKIDLYLSGHDHTMSVHEVKGVTYVVSGAASKRTTSSWFMSTSSAEKTLFSIFNVFGYTVVEAHGNSLDLRMVNSLTGETLFSHPITSRKSQRTRNTQTGVAVPEVSGSRGWSTSMMVLWSVLVVASWIAGTLIIKPLEIVKAVNL